MFISLLSGSISFSLNENHTGPSARHAYSPNVVLGKAQEVITRP